MKPYESPTTEFARSLPRPNPIWWGYWATSLLALIFSSAMVLLPKDDFSGYKPVAFVSSTIDLIALMGLFFYIRSTPILSKWFWRLVLVLVALKFTGPTIGLLMTAVTLTGIEKRVALIGAITSLWAIPLVYALWRYSFDRRLWSRAAA